ncbi:hypothetical protein Tsubulata_009058 [Turnera subulata]|uniref:Uncharacterized protein n=1 Tax=Turnera subulata TaxID=218843 RepID=A0A9Q0G1C0_9ROSI|nr:hypothetical protein Tsubulata_009058 [Turnera subulata]
MPGNEVGDRIHNFFGQESLIQGQHQHQHQAQVIDGNWHGVINNPWAANQRQIGTSFISNLKSPSVQQAADYERGHGSQSSGMHQAVNLPPLNLRPDLARSQPQGQQPTLNGYMQGHQVFQSRLNEAISGVDAESDQRHTTSKGFTGFESERGNGAELHNKNFGRMDFSESQVNFDLLRGQQLTSQNPGMLHSLARQQSGISDMQFLQQQLMLKQMQEMQRQQQLQKQQVQQQEARQLSSVTQVSNFVKQAGGAHSSSLINGIPVSDASNYSWQPELVAASTNWTQRGLSPVMQGSFRGNVFSPEPGQVPHLLTMAPQHVDQSLYGVPVSGARASSSEYSPIQMDKLQQMSGNSNSFQGNQYTAFQNQVNLQGGSLVSRQGDQGRNITGASDARALHSGFDLESLQHVNAQQRNEPAHEFHDRHELAGPLGASQEKTALEVGPSQNVATLDPTEEKILFGSDDNLWDAFGKGANISSGGFNVLEGTDVFGAFPSIQSGSWSALMQSAVAETSSSDMGVQEEWTGLTISNSERPRVTQQMLSGNESGKQQPTWASNSLQSESNLKSRGSMNFNNVLEVQQSTGKKSHEQSEMPQTGTRKFSQQFQGDGNRFLDSSIQRKEVPEGSDIDRKIPYFSDAEANVKNNSGPLTNQQNSSLLYNDDQPGSKSDGWNFFHSVLPSSSTTLKNQGTENAFDGSNSSKKNSSIRRADSFSPSVVDLGHAKSNPQVNQNDHNLNNVAALQDSNSIRGNLESSEHLPISSNIDIWKHVNTTANAKRNEITGAFLPESNKMRQNFDTAGINSLSNGTVETHEIRNSSVKETSTDVFRNASHQASSVGLRENAWSDAKESSVSSGSKQKSSNNIAWKPSGIRKFQYHPMGNVDLDSEPSHDAKQVARSLSTMQQVSQGLKGHDLRFTGPSKNSLDIEKGRLTGFQGETKGSDEIPSRSMLEGNAPSTPAASDGAAGNYAPNKATASSQNMLQLLHKVDRSVGQGNSPRFGSTNDHSSEMLEAETSDGSVHLQQNQSSASRGFGLQLTPPSQQLAADHSFLNQKPTQTTNVLSSSHLTSTTGEKGHAWLAPTSSLQSSPFSHEMSQGHSRNNSSSVGQTGKSVQGNLSAAFPSSFPYSRNLSNQHVADTGIQAKASQSANASFDGFASHLRQMNEGLHRAQTNQSLPDAARNRLHSDNASSVGMSQNYSKGPAQQFPVLEAAPAQPFTASGIAQEDASKLSRIVGTGISSQQHSFGSQPFKALSNMFRTNLPPNNNSETTSRPQKVEDQHAQSGGSGASESGACSENSYGFVGKDQLAKGDSLQPVSAEKAFSEMTKSTAHGKESVSGHFSGGSLSNLPSTEKDIEAFGRSLRSNNILHQNYSLSHQVQGMKNTELDPTSRSLKRLRGPDSALDAQAAATQGGQELYEQNIMVRDLSTNRTSIPSGDSKMLSFSAPDVQETNAPLHDSVGSGQSDTQSLTGNSTAISARGQHPQISPQMAPSWFDQYGTFKNGQILPAFEARQSATIKTPELPLPFGKSSDKMHVQRSIQHGNLVSADGFQNISTSTPTSLASENVPRPQLAGPDASNVNLVAARMKKRKSAMSDLVPLHKELMQGPQKPQNMSTAEVDWARATNRLTEKVENEAEMVDDGPPVFRSKRRLICSTQLMQLLLRPPAASVLSDDAIRHYETAAYFVARSTLGDTCNKASGAGSGVSVPSSTGNLHPEELKASGNVSDQYFSKVTEDLISRGRKLESELLRLDNRASVLDLRLECQDLEKFSVINRFARFHGRGQAEVVETSSSSDSPAASQKFPQRYVTALPMPRNLPERVQCFSL